MADASFNLRAVRGVAHRRAQRVASRHTADGATTARGRPRPHVIDTHEFRHLAG
jgi:hypothetical protein